MIDPQISFGGFDSDTSYEKAKDFPPRPYPAPLPTSPERNTWTPEVAADKQPSDKGKIFIINMVNLTLPILGLTILVGGIAAMVWVVTKFYN